MGGEKNLRYFRVAVTLGGGGGGVTFGILL